MMWIGLAAVSDALAVAAGALGSHLLEARLEPDMLSAWNKAVLYHLLHSVVLLALGLFTISSLGGLSLIAGWLSLLSLPRR